MSKTTEQQRARNRKWYLAHRDEAIAKAAAWKSSNPDASAAHCATYRENNRDECNARTAAWANENPEKQRAAVAAWNQANPERHAATTAAWAKAHPAECAAKTRRYRTSKRTPSWANLDYIEGIYELCDMFRNVGLDVEVDHIVPLQGKNVSGLHVEHNLQLMHSVMNKRKSNSFTI